MFYNVWRKLEWTHNIVWCICLLPTTWCNMLTSLVSISNAYLFYMAQVTRHQFPRLFCVVSFWVFFFSSIFLICGSLCLSNCMLIKRNIKLFCLTEKCYLFYSIDLSLVLFLIPLFVLWLLHMNSLLVPIYCTCENCANNQQFGE